MGAVKTFSLCFLSFALLGQVAQADPVPWTWWLTANSDYASSYNNALNSQNSFTAMSAFSAPITAATGPAPISTPAPAPTQTATPVMLVRAVNPVDAAPAPVSYSAPSAETLQAAPAATFSATSTAPKADAFLNLGPGPYANDSLITTGNTQPWYNSPQITSIFGGTPTSQQQADFAKGVLQDVQQTFNLSGVPVNLTTDPSVPAAHTLSLVSNTAAKLDPTAIGMTEIGGSGFSFINNIAPSASNLSQLQWIVAHNISHELMLAFGVPEDYDTSGNYIDARNASWSMMVNPNSTFSPDAAKALLARNFQGNTDNSIQGAQVLQAQTIPEPTTYAFWTLTLAGIALIRRRKFRRMAASQVGA